MTLGRVYTAFNLIVDGKARHYTLAPKTYALVPAIAPLAVMAIEAFDDTAMIVDAQGFMNLTEALMNGRCEATSAIPGPLLGTPIGWVGDQLLFNDDGELMV